MSERISDLVEATALERLDNLPVARSGNNFRVPMSLLGDGATLTIAADDANARTKAKADYVCDGVDDDVQIQAALNALPAAGGTVELSEGNLLVGNVSDFVSRSEIRGRGNSTIIKAADGLGQQSIFRANAITDIAIRDLQIDGNVAGNPRAGDADNQNGIEINGTDRFRVVNTYVHDTPDNGIAVMHGCTDGFIHSNKVSNPGWHGIMLWDDVHNVVVNGNYVLGAANNVGIIVEATAGTDPSTYNIVSDNIIQTCDRGIVDIDSNYVIISDNLIYDCAIVSIEVVASVQTVVGVNITGNLIQDQQGGQGCIRLNTTAELLQDLIVGENTIVGNSGYAMFISKSLRLSICNNIMTDNAGGIRFTTLAGHDYVLITGNISDNTNWDIFDLQGTNHLITDNLLLSPNKINGVLASATIKNNLGYVTENGGTSAAIATGGTIAHGLDATPTIVQVNAAEAGPTDITISVDATDITVNFGGGGNRTFFWSARVDP